MKLILTFLAIAIISFSFDREDGNIPERNIYGIWKGAFGDENKIEKLFIEFKPQNKMEVYKNKAGKHKITGTYIIKGDTTIIFSYRNEDGSSLVLMYGNLNKTKNFVDGIWEADIYTKGNFYLQKQRTGSLDKTKILPSIK